MRIDFGQIGIAITDHEKIDKGNEMPENTWQNKIRVYKTRRALLFCRNEVRRSQRREREGNRAGSESEEEEEANSMLTFWWIFRSIQFRVIETLLKLKERCRSRQKRRNWRKICWREQQHVYFIIFNVTHKPKGTARRLRSRRDEKSEGKERPGTRTPSDRMSDEAKKKMNRKEHRMKMRCTPNTLQNIRIRLFIQAIYQALSSLSCGDRLAARRSEPNCRRRADERKNSTSSGECVALNCTVFCWSCKSD